MSMPGSLLLTLLILFLTNLATSDQDAAYSSNAQFIYYNGTLSGTYVSTTTKVLSCGSNGTIHFGGLNSLMRIGVTPPWDPNPFFFELNHYGKQASSSASKLKGVRAIKAEDLEKRYCLSLGGCTTDAIYNLDFATVWMVCQTDGHACPWVTDSWYYIPAEMVDLNKSSVTVVDNGVALSNTDSSAFYSVVGDERSWVSNGTVDYDSFDFQMPGNGSGGLLGAGCSPDGSFNWNDAQHMTYNVNFTNTTSVAEFTITNNETTVTLLFSGTRDDSDLGAGADNRPNDGMSVDRLNTIALADPKTHPMPHFMFANGSDFHFSDDKSYGWVLVKGSSASSVRDGLFVRAVFVTAVISSSLLFW